MSTCVCEEEMEREKEHVQADAFHSCRNIIESCGRLREELLEDHESASSKEL